MDWLSFDDDDDDDIRFCVPLIRQPAFTVHDRAHTFTGEPGSRGTHVKPLFIFQTRRGLFMYNMKKRDPIDLEILNFFFPKKTGKKFTKKIIDIEI